MTMTDTAAAVLSDALLIIDSRVNVPAEWLAGVRDEAARVRSDATRAYSRAWDDRARRQLEAMLRRATRPTPVERVRGRGHGRRVRPPVALPER